MYSLSGYVFLQRNRNGGTGGGIGNVLKREIKFKRRYDLENHLESLWIKICLKSFKTLLIGCYYQPPGGSKYLISNVAEVLEEQLTNLVITNKELIILGDFNINFNKTDNRDFKLLLDIFGSKRGIAEPTRASEMSSNLKDLITTNREIITSKDVFGNSIPNHNTITSSRKINNIRYNTKTIKCRNYSNYSPEELKPDVAKINWLPVHVDLLYFTSSLRLVFKTHSPHIEKRGKDIPCPWLYIDNKNLMNRRHQTLRKSRKPKSGDSWKSHKTLRNKCNTKIKKAKSNHHKNCSVKQIYKPNKFLSQLKNVLSENSQSIASV